MKSVISIVAMAAIAGVAAGQNVVMNGGFEMGTGGDSDFWNEFEGGAAGTASMRSSDAPIAGDWSHVLDAVGDDTQGASAGINYNSIADGGFVSLQENTIVNMSFEADVDLGPGGVGFFVLRVLNADGAIVADTGLQNLANGLNTTADLLVPAFAAAPNDTYAAFAEISVGAGAFEGSLASAKIDNVIINGTLVPAPAAVSMLGLGGLVAARRRRG